MAGEVTAKITRSMVVGTVSLGTTPQNVSGDSVQQLQKTIPLNTTDGVFDIVGDISTFKAVGMESSQALTIKTYASAVLKDTIVLAANVPLVWTDSDDATHEPCPFTNDFDVIKVTNTAACLFKLLIVSDSTPVLA